MDSREQEHKAESLGFCQLRAKLNLLAPGKAEDWEDDSPGPRPCERVEGPTIRRGSACS